MFYISQQKAKTSTKEILYDQKAHSEALNVNVAPVFLNEESLDEIIFENNQLELVVQFKAKPWPQENEIVWSFIEEDGNTVPIDEITGLGQFHVKNLHEIGVEEFKIETVLVN